MTTQDQVKKLFKCERGGLVRAVTCKSSKAGSIAGTKTAKGYIRVSVDGKRYNAHGLVFLYHHGYMPKFIDHINGIRDDNRIENLRECTESENGMNRKKIKGCSSKYKGVSWNRSSKKWKSSIKLNGKAVSLGEFWCEDVASQVVRIKRLEMHGEFANHG
jgi:hypothetical protein